MSEQSEGSQTGAGWVLLGALLCGLSVATGAFAAHGLERSFGERYAGQTKQVAGETIPAATKYIRDFKTAAEYQMTHALGLIFIGLLRSRATSRLLDWAGWLLLLGIVLFSGSLYILTLTGVTKWGMVTPFGGVCFLLGWTAVVIAAWQQRSASRTSPS